MGCCTNSSPFPDMTRTRQNLEKQRARILAQAMALATDESETAALRTHLDRLELLAKLRKAQTAQHDTRDGLIVTLLLTSLLGILLAFHLPAITEVSATVESVRFVAAHLELSGQAVYGNGTARFSSSDQIRMKTKPTYPNFLKITQVRPGSTHIAMSLTRTGACDQLTVTEGNLDITLINDAGAATTSSVVPMRARAGSMPSSLTLCGATVEPLLLKIRVVKLALARDTVTAGVGSDDEPVIKEGTVRFAHEQHALSLSDLLYLEAAPDRASVAHKQLRISSSASGYLVHFGGSVRHLHFGGPNIDAERTPSMLDYLIKNSPWLSVYSALAAGIGLIWGIRKIVRGG